jgi:hypothetical protein
MTHLLQRKPSASCHKSPHTTHPHHWQSDEEIVYILYNNYKLAMSSGYKLESEREREREIKRISGESSRRKV